jgi:hypothetical protein
MSLSSIVLLPPPSLRRGRLVLVAAPTNTLEYEYDEEFPWRLIEPDLRVYEESTLA